MKHLRKFNETKIGDSVKEFCDNYLSFLKDNGFTCYVNGNNFNTHITITKTSNDFNVLRFKYSDIADDFIPFLNLLSKKYKISFNNVGLNTYKPQRKLSEYNRLFSIDQILNNEVPEDASCQSIWIQVDGFN